MSDDSFSFASGPIGSVGAAVESISAAFAAVGTGLQADADLLERAFGNDGNGHALRNVFLPVAVGLHDAAVSSGELVEGVRGDLSVMADGLEATEDANRALSERLGLVERE